MDVVKAPPVRAPLDEESTGLTSGEVVYTRSRTTYVLAVIGAVVGTGLGMLLGVVVAARYPSVLASFGYVATPGGAAAVVDTSAPLVFLVVGDWGRRGENNQTLVAQAMGVVAGQLRPSFVVSTGDNFYDHGLKDENDDQFFISFSDIYSVDGLKGLQWHAVLGNHDYIQNADAQMHPALRQRDPRWHCERNFRHRYAPACPANPTEACTAVVELFFIDTSPLMSQYWGGSYETLNFTSLGSYDQAVSFELQTLRDALQSSDAKWKMVIGHHPLFSSGEHGGTQELQNHLLPLLEEFNVDIYINGHDHNLELIRMPDRRTIFLTSGAGSKIRTARTPDVPGTTVFYHDSQGFASVAVAQSSAELRFYDSAATLLHTTVVER